MHNRRVSLSAEDHRLIDHFAHYLAQDGKKPATIDSYCRDAKRFVNYLNKFRMPIASITPATLVHYQDYLVGELGEQENSVRRTVIGVRQFFRCLAKAGNLGGSPFDEIAIPQRVETSRCNVTMADLQRVLQAAAKTQPGIKSQRDVAIVALLAFEGLKASELIELKWSDFLGHSLSISGDRPRAIRLDSQTAEALKRYRQHFASLELSCDHHNMFIAFKGKDLAVTIPKLTRHGLKFVIYELGEAAGLTKLNAEQLRSFAMNHLLQRGLSSEEIMTHLGLRGLGKISRILAQPKAEH